MPPENPPNNRAARRRLVKIQRNDLCPCGSGKRFKHCHGNAQRMDDMRGQLEQVRRREMQRAKQQGFTVPFVSVFHERSGMRVVGVGLRVWHSKEWKAVADFLSFYIKTILGSDWGNSEIAKPFEQRHPVLQWYDAVCRHQKATIPVPGIVTSAPITGAVGAYFGLAYALCLLEHNSTPLVRKKLIPGLLKRLKDKQQFPGAYYETLVIAAFLKAGFKIEPLEHLNKAQKKVEFIATSPLSGRKYSVETKARQWQAGENDDQSHVADKLYTALKKPADHDRIIFIELDSGQAVGVDKKPTPALEAANEVIASKEASLTIDGKPAPPAYVILTDHPHRRHLHNVPPPTVAYLTSFKMPDLNSTLGKFVPLRELIQSRKRHADIFHLLKCMETIDQLPSTFDGETAGIAFHGGAPPFRLGDKVPMFGPKGESIEVKVTNAVVVPEKAEVTFIGLDATGNSLIGNAALSDAQIAAYKEYPEFYFGEYQNVGKNITDPIEFYEWVHKNYKATPRERLLELISEWPDKAAFVDATQQILAEEYALRITASVVGRWQSEKAAG